MKALLIPGDHVVRLEELPDPVPGPGEVRIRMHRSGICGTDLHFLRETIADRGERGRTVPGHESAGVVESVGPGVTARRVGERVIGYHHIGCGSCHHCRADVPTQCASKTVTGRTRHGSNAEFEVLPAWAVFPLDDAFSFDAGVLLACNVSTAFSALRKGDVRATTTVAVFGQGVVGQSAVMLARAMGARVAAVDPSGPRRETARALGAELTLDPTTDDVVGALARWGGGRGVQVALECSGNGQAVRAALDALGPHGVLVFVGGGSQFAASSNDLLGREATLVGSSVYRPSEYDLLTRFVRERGLDLDALVEEVFPPERAAEAYARAGEMTARKLLFDWT